MAFFRSLVLDDLPRVHALLHADDARITAPLLIGSPRPIASESLDRLAERFRALTPPNVWVGAFAGEEDDDDAALVAIVELNYAMQQRQRHVMNLALYALSPHASTAEKLVTEIRNQVFLYGAIVRIVCEVAANERSARALLGRAGFQEEVVQKSALRTGYEMDDLLMFAATVPDLPKTVPTPALPRPPRLLRLDDVRIRPSEVVDADVLGTWFSDPSILQHTYQMPFENKHKWQRLLRSNLESAHVHSFVATHKEAGIVGSCVLLRYAHWQRQHELHLGISIRPDAQGQGIGEKLMRYLLAFSERIGATRVSLDVNESNGRGIALYEKVGFIREGLQVAKTMRSGAYESGWIMAYHPSRAR